MPESEIAVLAREYQATGDRKIRNRIVEANLHLVDYHVNRFAHSRGVSVDDLRQAAFIAMIHAVERFNPERGVGLRTFASRTIEGELKRFLRDSAWAVRPPRRLQELNLQVRRVAEEMTHALGRPVTVAELSSRVGVSEEQILEGLDAGHARTADSLDLREGDSARPRYVASALSKVDESFGSVDAADGFNRVLKSLSAREQAVVRMRFIDQMSQPQIAETVGISQSYVSRILKSSLLRLRAEMV